MFDQVHRLHQKKIEDGYQVIVYDSSQANQRSSMRNFARHWFGLYLVIQVNDNATYQLTKLDGTKTVVVIIGNRIKVFKKH